MQTQSIGRGELAVTRFGFGASGLGNLFEIVPDDRAQATLRTAWDAGIRYYDTSPLYGFGLSELRLGQFLRSVPREDFVVSTKVGRYFVPPRGEPVDRGPWTAPLGLRPVLDYTYDGTMRSLEQSYVRLGLSRIDIALIHDLDRRNQGKDFDRRFAEAMDGAYRALDELRRSGEIAAIGVGINEADVCARFARAGDFDCMMLAGRYTLLEQGALDEFLPLAEQKKIKVLLAGVFNSGILASGPTPSATYDYGDAPAEIIDRARRLAHVAAEFGVPLAAAALQFVQAHPAVASVVIGMTKPERVVSNAELMSTRIPRAFWSRLAALGLIRQDAPIPSDAKDTGA
jgi:D-threo-aldose 1-dehydrogenase